MRLEQQGPEIIQRIGVVWVKAERLAQQRFDIRVELAVRQQRDAASVQSDGKQLPRRDDIAAQLYFRAADGLRLIKLLLRDQFPCPLQSLVHAALPNPVWFRSEGIMPLLAASAPYPWWDAN
jgi:hypothetical protein